MRFVSTFLLCAIPWAASPAADAPASFDELFRPDTTFPYFTEVADWPDEDDPGAWSSKRAAILAQLSSLVYVPDAAQVKNEAMKAGFHTARFIEGGSSQVWVFENDVVRILVFRGTEPGNTEDLLTDVRILPTDFIDGVRAHSGFVDALAAVSPQLDAMLANGVSKSLWLSGHSLGGALAQLYAWRQPERRVGGVVVFGAPRVFSSSDKARVSAAFRCFRVVNNNDVVPHLPTPPLYAHIGTEWFIDASRRLQREPTIREKFSAAWQGHRDYAARWLSHWHETGDLRLVPGAAIADHAPAAYARALIAAASAREPSDAGPTRID